MSYELPFGSSSDDKDEVNSELAFFMEACTSAIEVSKPKRTRNQVPRDRYRAHDRLAAAYFSEHTQYDEATFRRIGISALVNCTSAIRQMAYDTFPDALNEYLQMGATIACDNHDEQRRVNVLRESPVFNDLKKGKALDVPFVAKDVTYPREYYLTNRIYSE
nr:reverse transcriptase domain-containing protein [Tanacetum cinerariifolium]